MGNDTPGNFPNSTYRDSFREIILPKGNQAALGVQVVGGKFYEFFKRGTKGPASKTVMMTSTSDKQTSMDVVVVLCDDSHNYKGRKLGEFELDGIAPARAGNAQVQVCFSLSNDNTLRVTANDVQGNRQRALTVKERIRLG